MYFSTNYFYGTQVTTFLAEGRVSISKKFKSCLALTKDTIRRAIHAYGIRWSVSVSNKSANGVVTWGEGVCICVCLTKRRALACVLV